MVSGVADGERCLSTGILRFCSDGGAQVVGAGGVGEVTMAHKQVLQVHLDPHRRSSIPDLPTGSNSVDQVPN